VLAVRLCSRRAARFDCSRGDRRGDLSGGAHSRARPLLPRVRRVPAPPCALVRRALSRARGLPGHPGRAVCRGRGPDTVRGHIAGRRHHRHDPEALLDLCAALGAA
jgi:hypothetical protein